MIQEIIVLGVFSAINYNICSLGLSGKLASSLTIANLTIERTEICELMKIPQIVLAAKGLIAIVHYIIFININLDKKQNYIEIKSEL